MKVKIHHGAAWYEDKAGQIIEVSHETCMFPILEDDPLYGEGTIEKIYMPHFSAPIPGEVNRFRLIDCRDAVIV